MRPPFRQQGAYLRTSGLGPGFAKLWTANAVSNLGDGVTLVAGPLLAATLFDNAAISILPAVVPKEQLARANGRLLGVHMVANELVAPPLGGLLFATAAAVPFLLDAGTYAAAAGDGPTPGG